MIEIKSDHPLIPACQKFLPEQLRFSQLAELRVTETGFSIRSALPKTMHFGIVQVDFSSYLITFSDYDAYYGNVHNLATIQLSELQVNELKSLL